MNGKAAHQQYATVHFTTLDRGRLLLMMYDGGLNFLKHAKAGLESRDVVKFAKYLSKSQAIIGELMNTLDFEKGGVIAKDLDRLYDFMLFYLTEANLQKDASKIQRVIDLLETITTAYREVIESGRYIKEIESNATPAHNPSQPVAPARTPAATTEEETPRIRISL